MREDPECIKYEPGLEIPEIIGDCAWDYPELLPRQALCLAEASERMTFPDDFEIPEELDLSDLDLDKGKTRRLSEKDEVNEAKPTNQSQSNVEPEPEEEEESYITEYYWPSSVHFLVKKLKKVFS
jgi:hypothetical protein